MDNHKVSIITPVYNGELYIRECIESVKAQSDVNFEHIVVDDGSNDSTASIVEEYAHVILVKQENKGAPSARNNGLRVSRGEYIKFLDSDDVLCPGVLSLQLEQSKFKGKNEIVYGYHEVFNDTCSSAVHKRLEEVKGENKIVNIILDKILITLPLYPVAALKSVGGFDERLIARQEWNLNLKLVLKNYHFKYHDVLIFRQRFHGLAHRISNRKLDANKEIENLKCACDPILTCTDLEVQRAHSYFVWNVARHFIASRDYRGARLLFDYAISISPTNYDYHFGSKYSFLVKLLGPCYAEVIRFFYKK